MKIDADRQRGVVPFALLTMFAVGPLNYVVYKVLFATYGTAHALFVMQGVNVLYVVYGGVVTAYLKHATGAITPAMEALERWPFAAMALLDCLGGLLAALGAAETPGQLQTLLNQSLVPCTMLASSVLLGASYAWTKCGGAAIVLLGAVIVVLGDAAAAAKAPEQDDDIQRRATAPVLVYWASNVPMALSAVFKEWHFSDKEVHVMYLTQQVSIYQFLLGFATAPVLTLPGVASPTGLAFTDVISGFFADCLAWRPTSTKGMLLLSYVLANFVLNLAGMTVVKRGGAALSAVAYSVLLPCTTLAFGAPALGPYREPIRAATLAGLVVVLAGFAAYQWDDLRGVVPGEEAGLSKMIDAASPRVVEDDESARRPRSKTSYDAVGAGPAPADAKKTAVELPPVSKRTAGPPEEGAAGGDDALPVHRRRRRATAEVDAFHERILLVRVPVGRRRRRGSAPGRHNSRSSLFRSGSFADEAEAGLVTRSAPSSPDLRRLADQGGAAFDDSSDSAQSLRLDESSRRARWGAEEDAKTVTLLV